MLVGGPGHHIFVLGQIYHCSCMTEHGLKLDLSVRQQTSGCLWMTGSISPLSRAKIRSGFSSSAVQQTRMTWLQVGVFCYASRQKISGSHFSSAFLLQHGCNIKYELFGVGSPRRTYVSQNCVFQRATRHHFRSQTDLQQNLPVNFIPQSLHLHPFLFSLAHTTTPE